MPRKKRSPYTYELEIELDQKWYENSSEQFDVKEYLDALFERYIGFRGRFISSEIKKMERYT